MQTSPNKSVSSFLQGLVLAVCISCALTLFACASSGSSGAPMAGTPQVGNQASSGNSSEAAVVLDESSQSKPEIVQPTSSSSSEQSQDVQPEEIGPVYYPCGWLAAPFGDIPAGEPVNILRTGAFDIRAHVNGAPVSDERHTELSAEWPELGEGEVLVAYGEQLYLVPESYVLVNMPDFLPGVVFDIVYAYSTTSQCAGEDIPGVTGTCLPGYVEGKQANAYLGHDQFAVPCAYATALKARYAEELLEERGYRLLVFDAYRPMTAQWYLSDSFSAACANNSVMQASMGAWGLGWYVANGASGHNFGADLDVGVCDQSGEPIAMPSAFDAFDDTGHLTAYPMDSASITPDSYCSAVAENEACMALHEAFVSAGFSELASEWWHFGDGTGAYQVQSVAGGGGLDFVAYALAA